jgi:transcriptional regulator GlxA family with amidase domain
MRVAVLAYGGCMASGVSGFADTLSVANHILGREVFATTVLSAGGAAVRCFSGTVMPVGGALGGSGGDASGWDVVYVPPAFGLAAPDPDLSAWVGRMHAGGAMACAACAGVFFLAEAGILRGRVATTHWGLAESFAARYPDVALEPDRMLVDGGDYVCAGGVTAYFDLALHLVARHASPEAALSCARTLLLDPGRVRQTPYMSLLPTAADETVARACRWLEENHARPVRMRELAEAVLLTERTLLRRFRGSVGRTPVQYLQAVRIERAKRLLETGGESAGEIAAMVGYADATAFFKAFRELTGLTPGEYRRRFGIASPQ